MANISSDGILLKMRLFESPREASFLGSMMMKLEGKATTKSGGTLVKKQAQTTTKN